LRALVDTGSPLTLFTPVAALRLGVDLENYPKPPRKVQILGAEHDAVMISAHMRLDPFEDVVWEADVGILLEDLDLPFSGVLGTEGFLDRWVVSFNKAENYFVVEKPKIFSERFHVDPVQMVLDRFGDQDWWPPGT
jgi:hypothetical protein